MAAIAPSFLLMLALAAPTPRDIVSNMAADLSNDNPSGFLRAVSKSMPEYEELSTNVNALARSYDIASSIEILDEKESALEVDWFLELKSRAGTGELIRRRERVKLTFAPSGKRLQIKSLQPISLFALP